MANKYRSQKPPRQLVPLRVPSEVGEISLGARSAMGAILLNPLDYPTLPKGSVRKIFVRGCDLPTQEKLEEKGYEIVDLITMPRGTVEQNLAYLLARVQAAEEGTVFFTEMENKMLHLEMRAYGLLDRRDLTINIGQNSSEKSDVEGLLNWGKSRHSLAGNTTVVGQGASRGKFPPRGDSPIEDPVVPLKRLGRSPEGRPPEGRAPLGVPGVPLSSSNIVEGVLSENSVYSREALGPGEVGDLGEEGELQ